MTKVFIDGSAGTTGLRIKERLAARGDLELIILSEESRKDAEKRKAALNSCDLAFLCLPDAAAIEAVSFVENPNVKIIDTSTAHRTADGWVYGMPELTGQRELIKGSTRIANPGCHASGFVALVRPLIENRLLSPDAKLSCFSLTGYSGGGKTMIADYESAQRDVLLDAPRQYALGQTHKHLPEMVKLSGLNIAPVFCPIVSDFYSGMEVTVPIFADELSGCKKDVAELFSTYYNGGLIRFAGEASEGGLLSAGALSGKDYMEISVHGNDERLILTARFDNLGKGASGAAIQNMNILLGVDEALGLDL